MTRISSLCVFCGSKTGDDPAFEAAARRFGELMVERGVRLVFGGGRIGLMGESSQAQNVLAVLSALERVLPQHGFEVGVGAGIAAASQELVKHPVAIP